MRSNKRQVQILPRYPMGTIAGFGWLREAPRPVYQPPRANQSPAEIERHAALRKCIYFPAMSPLSPARVPAAVRAADRVKTDPALFRPPLRRRGAGPEGATSRPLAQEAPWRDDPVTVGILLAILPPLGFMLLWGSPRYSRDAKLAITALMSVFMVLATAAICTALIVMR